MAGQFPAVAVTGPRQSGKSTLLKTLFPQHRYVSFDDLMLREQAAREPDLFLDNAGPKVILDEIQYVPEILSYLKLRVDQKRRQMGRYLLTGSQSFALIKNLGETLAGRVGLLELLPFSAGEKDQIPGRGRHSALDQFVGACLRGNFPELCVRAKLEPALWYAAYVQTYLERDIRGLYDIGSLRDFQRFLQLLAARCAQNLNYSNLASDIGVSVNTIKKWISVLEAGRLVFLLPPYHYHFRKRITKSPKIYFTDCGLVCYLTGIRDRASLLNGPLAGALFENYCVQETLKTYFNLARRPGIFYVQAPGGFEVDLIIEYQAGKIRPCEIKMTKTPRPAHAENLERLRAISPKLDIQEGRVVSLTERDWKLTPHSQAVSLNRFLAELGQELK